MAEFAFPLTPAPALGGADLTLGNTRIRERDDMALVSFATPLGGEAALAAALKDAWDLALPAPTRSTASGQMRAIRTAPDQMLLVFPRTGADAEATVQARLNGAGYTTVQTDAWVVLDLTGPETGPALERLSPVDLSPAAFPPGATARTVMDHLGVLVLATGPDQFLLFSARSSAAAFLHAVETSVRNVIP